VSNPRIYIVIATFLPMVGGAEKQALLHARSLQERGFAVTIVTLRHDRAWLPREVIEGVSTVRVAGKLLGDREKLPGPLRKLLYLIGLLVMSWTLWQHRQHFDVIHLYQLGLQALVVGLACRLTGKPLVISVRCTDAGKRANLPDMSSLLAGSLDAPAPWLKIDGQARRDDDLAQLEWLGKPVVRFTRSLLQHIHAVIIILSSRTQDYLTEHDFSLPNIILIPNGVDITRFHSTRADISNPAQQDERTHVVVCVSRLTYQKGIDVLLQAWRIVQQESLEARLIIVGIGPLQAQLERLAQAFDVQGSIEFAGLHHDVPAQLHRASLAVLPSYFEGMSNALLEAMSCGLPCVATRVSGNEDIINHGFNGLLVEPGDYQGLAEALLKLLRDPVLVLRLGHAARETIEKHYSLEHITDIYVELYQRIAGCRLRLMGATQPSEIYRLPS